MRTADIVYVGSRCADRAEEKRGRTHNVMISRAK